MNKQAQHIIDRVSQDNLLIQQVITKGPAHFNEIHKRVVWFFRFDYNKYLTHAENWANAIAQISRTDANFRAT